TYFSGFFRQYDLQITTCSGSDSLLIQPQNALVPCFSFFRNLIGEQGFKLPGTNFFYMDNMNGRISYFGELYFPSIGEDYSGISIFLELNSRLVAEGVGFPELLIDKSMKKPDSYKRFEYAKYYGGELVNRYGDYPYNNFIYSYNFSEEEEFSRNTWDGYEHLIYCTKDDNYVIASRILYKFVDYLISFPYLFVFYFISSLVIIFFTRPLKKNAKATFDLKFKIQTSIISIVFVSLLLVAAGTIFYNLENYRSRLEKDLNSKMSSVSVEVDMRLENESEFDPELVDWLSAQLVSLSNIFNTDINIFGINGDLVVSSRLELFNKGLVSHKMSSRAYYELFENFQTNYFQSEEIGRLKYLSAYTPIINRNGHYLGFLNLPYFTHQDKYSQEVSTFIVAFINLYVLLFLASIFVAVFISNQITHPLVTIRENLRKMDLGKRNEHINYRRDDEIGKLVEEYNKKVDELGVSADLLARSERESAWREMAKQVAHEIKNPLTPMKLNIQHLQRFKGSEADYRKTVNRIAQTLIDQINTLSNIATEFSNFAKIPTANKQEFNLSDLILRVTGLYENDNRVNIHFVDETLAALRVNADMEQLSRALINLIKNGIQAIPAGRKGMITIGLISCKNMAVISVQDNGIGIPEELREKMFSPNFTTKSSGMGLGLAIVKNAVENFEGKVWFTTESGKGSTFYLEIPVLGVENQ
ncbi:MAG: ATP-binding protein, partial [Prolixibacteraceae bacterium]|nr:ATP-binding protein [Prolixibacteraceae bacterium]